VRDHSRSRLVSRSPERGAPRHPLARLPPFVSRFLGYRDAEAGPSGALIPGLRHVPQRVESVIMSALGCFVAILLVESILIGSPLFVEVWANPPLVIASLGATAVLVYGTMESPLSQPRNVLGGQMLSALTSICVVQLFKLNPHWRETSSAGPGSFQDVVWVAAALAMALSQLVMDVTKTIHPPGGATALLIATLPAVDTLAWRFLLELFACVTVMLGWAFLWNNLGRRKYPLFWFAAPTPPKPQPKPDPPKDVEEGKGPAGPANGHAK